MICKLTLINHTQTMKVQKQITYTRKFNNIIWHELVIPKQKPKSLKQHPNNRENNFPC